MLNNLFAIGHGKCYIVVVDLFSAPDQNGSVTAKKERQAGKASLRMPIAKPSSSWLSPSRRCDRLGYIAGRTCSPANHQLLSLRFGWYSWSSDTLNSIIIWRWPAFFFSALYLCSSTITVLAKNCQRFQRLPLNNIILNYWQHTTTTTRSKKMHHARCHCCVLCLGTRKYLSWAARN